MNKKKVLIAAAAIACVAIAAAVLFLRSAGGRLVIRNADTGEVYLSYPLEQGEEFSITFVHSVNKTPVTDVYDVQ